MISEKNILKTDLEGKNSYKEIPGEKNSYTGKICLMAYTARKKILHC